MQLPNYNKFYFKRVCGVCVCIFAILGVNLIPKRFPNLKKKYNLCLRNADPFINYITF